MPHKHVKQTSPERRLIRAYPTAAEARSRAKKEDNPKQEILLKCIRICAFDYFTAPSTSPERIILARIAVSTIIGAIATAAAAAIDHHSVPRTEF